MCCIVFIVTQNLNRSREAALSNFCDMKDITECKQLDALAASFLQRHET